MAWSFEAECPSCSRSIILPAQEDEIFVTTEDEVYHESCWLDGLTTNASSTIMEVERNRNA